jgi:hypothetical protein
MKKRLLFFLCLLSVTSLFSQPILPVAANTTLPNLPTREQWTPDSTRDIIIDNDSLEFRLERGENYMLHQRGLGTSKAIWNPTIKTTGFYEIFVTYTPHSNRATNATYTIYFDRGTSYKTIDQTELIYPWVSLGVYPFVSSNPAKIVLTDLADGYVVADVLILTPRNNGGTITPAKQNN